MKRDTCSKVIYCDSDPRLPAKEMNMFILIGLNMTDAHSTPDGGQDVPAIFAVQKPEDVSSETFLRFMLTGISEIAKHTDEYIKSHQ